ncbi:helix-turn-helix domain-containing protein [Phocaeicola sp. Sa1YUN3]|uniref:Helix-turn-helix domain-containing protein n=2 Tax=Phocaeicola faecium TaxID=2762213 RepID=A0ABR8V8G9_9BACT|nr:helix-turn-helix domain-containing protein [Phocaeicola faecium]
MAGTGSLNTASRTATMNETITLETMPKAMAYLITKVEALEKALMEKSETPTAPADRWMNIDELKAYLPDHPAKATIYGWVSKREIPYHKGGKKLRFLQSDIDKWLSNGKRKSESELKDEADKYCETRKIG